MGNPLTFVSKRRELRLIVKPSDRTFDEARRPVILRGERVEFTNHRFTTSDDGLIGWLKQHPLFGKEFTSADGATKPIDTVKLVEGANKTVNKMELSPASDEIQAKAEAEEIKRIFEAPPSKEEITSMIDKKFDEMFSRFTQIFQTGAQTKEEVVKQKKVFTCPVEGCGQTFRSGVEVGRHKKLAHPSN